MLLRSARADFRGNFVQSPNVSGAGLVIPPEASRSNPIVPPAVWTCEASFHARRMRPKPAGTDASRALRSPGGGHSVTRPILPAMRRLFVLLVAATLFASCGGSTAAGPDRPVRILSGSPTTLDPAAQGDSGSAAITAQLFESLTSFDADLQVRPALAESWRFSDDGRQVTFHLRPDLTFSDGSPLAAIRRRAQLAAPDRSGPARRRWPRSPSTSPAPRPTCAGPPPTRRRSGCMPMTAPATSSSTSSGRPPISSTSSPARPSRSSRPGWGRAPRP